MSAIYPAAGDPRKLAELLRQNINPAYAHQIGTESHERRICAEAIEAQAARIADLEAALNQLRDRVIDEYDRIYISGVLGK